MENLHFDKKGKKISFLEWGKLFDDKNYKIVKQETLPNGKFVSTVWLGINHNFYKDKDPLIFETMVFPEEGNWGDIDCNRYSTLKEAKAGHKKMVKKSYRKK